MKITMTSNSVFHHLIRTLLCSLLMLNASAFAETTASASATPPAHIATEVPQARLAGGGMFTWYGLSVYEAQLWVGNEGFNSDKPLASRFALDLNYARALVGSKIAEASIDEIEKLKIGSKEQHQAWLTQMKALFPNVDKGTHITGIYLPKESARFYLNGKLLGEIKDPAFAQAFFAIWLDKNTTAPSLRSKLLQGASTPTR